MNKMSEPMNRKKEKNQHIQVFVRVRPTNQNELATGKSFDVIEVPTSRELIIRERPQDKTTKKFTFDRVFDPKSKQIDVYNAVVSPMVEEVLAGYNCTVFAYGQTGTGKTFTMEGHSNDPAIHWQSDTSAGIIPRSLSHLFDQLRLQGSQEYTVKVSFLEIYNEELADLLAACEDMPKLRIFDDTAKKGSVIIHGLEEVIVHNKSEVYKILERGSEKRQTAATLMNAKSSRSHTVFSITVHMKEVTPEGEELIKTGKLNLVDLAGSENVGRSGAVDRRAREAGNINQSLLTLGRVITSLVERAPHVPYRESKLTRLLQESLGGRTKTSIIATVSPSNLNLEETLSTLDYAHRAKNITNRPEINQKLMKVTLLKEYTEEIERLRRDLNAARDRNGIYIDPEDFTQMQNSLDFQSKEIEEKLNHIKALEDTMAAKEKLFEGLKMNLENTKEKVKQIRKERNEQRYLVETYANVKDKLTEQAKVLLNVADTVTNDKDKLHEKIERKNHLEQENMSKGLQLREDIQKDLKNMQINVENYVEATDKASRENESLISRQIDCNSRAIEESVHIISNEMMNRNKNVIKNILEFYDKNQQFNSIWFDQLNAHIKSYDEDKQKFALAKLVDQKKKQEEIISMKVIEKLENLEMQINERLNALEQCVLEKIAYIRKKVLEKDGVMEKKLKNLEEIHTQNIEAQKSIEQEEEKFQKQLNNIWNEYKQKIEQTKLVRDNCIKYSYDTIECSNEIKENWVKVKEEGDIFNKYIENEAIGNLKSMGRSVTSSLSDNRIIFDQNKIVMQDFSASFEKNQAKNSNEIKSYKCQLHTDLQNYTKHSQTNFKQSFDQIKELENCIQSSQSSHENLMNTFKNTMTSDMNALSTKMTDQSRQCLEFELKIKNNLDYTAEKVDKFFKEELKQDEPTGMTPAKRDYNYPRSIVTMSPAERIVKRYRVMVKSRENSDDDMLNSDGDDNTPLVNNFQINEFITPDLRVESKKKSTSASKSKDVSKLTGEPMIPICKSVSVSEMHSLEDQSILENHYHSDNECYSTTNSSNKENNKTVKEKKTLQPPKINSRIRTSNNNSKRILSSRND